MKRPLGPKRHTTDNRFRTNFRTEPVVLINDVLETERRVVLGRPR